MTTRRARNHKDMVAFEKKFHHRAGIHLHQHYKTRWGSLIDAMFAESPDDWSTHAKQYSELEQEWNDRFYGGRFWKCPECGFVNVSEENITDWAVKKCHRCKKMILIIMNPYKVGGLNHD